VTPRTTSSRAGHLTVKNVRDPVSRTDGRRILVDRLWPRGVSKDRAQLSAWLRDLAPSHELRKWFDHDPARWKEFRRRYYQELEARDQLAVLRELRDLAAGEPVTLLYGASDREHNDAVALLEFADRL
jgi:uncharacterized protein YeaO (DUF488 family)